MNGRVVNVAEHVSGSELSAAVLAAVTAIDVVDVDEFDFNGGTLKIDDGTNSEILAYSIADDSEGEITLASALANAYASETPVTVYPQTIERLAYVVSAEQEEPLEAIVPHSLYDRVPNGVRDLDAGEAVDVASIDGELTVIDVRGVQPAADVGYLDGLEINVGTVDIDTQASPTANSSPIAHGLSDTPTTIICTVKFDAGRGTSRVVASYGAEDEDTFHIRLRTVDGSNLNAPSGGAFVRVGWIAHLSRGGFIGRPNIDGGEVEAVGSDATAD